MDVFTFSPGSTLKEITVHHDGDRPSVMWLEAKETVPVDQVAGIRHAIERNGWQCVPANIDGRNILQVKGFKTEDECVQFLTGNNFIAGTPQITQKPEAVSELPRRSGIKDFFQRRSLPLAGALNLVGDAGLLGGGVRTGDKYKIAGGILYTAGGANLMAFGHGGKPEYSSHSLSQRTVDYIHHMAGSTETSGTDAYQNDTELHAVKDALHHNAAQNTLAAYTAGAGAMLASGIQKHQEGKGSAGLYYGISSVLFKFTSFLIPEKSKGSNPAGNEDGIPAKNSGPLSKIGNWVMEKPLRIFGYGSLITDSLLALDSYQDFKRTPKQKNYLWTLLTAATYIAADLMIAISSKNPKNAVNPLSADEQLEVVARAAEEIAKKPEEKRTEFVEHVSEFLVDQPEVRGKHSDIAASIRRQVESMKNNPWAERVSSSNMSMQPEL